MHKETCDILTPHSKPRKVCAMGNVAIARGAIEAGVSGVFSYPGTPSTEISEVFKYVDEFQRDQAGVAIEAAITANRIYFEYSINEKIALEKAIAWSIAYGSALCVMKNVGLNVASDALMSIPYQTIGGPLVLVVCDDPGCHSSSNEQDSRYWAQMANVPLLDPADPAQALVMTRAAFELSAQLKLPVILRTTTRVSHSRSIVEYRGIKATSADITFDRLKEHINVPARTADAHVRLLQKLSCSAVRQMQKRYVKFWNKGRNNRLGILGSGIALVHLREALMQTGDYEKVDLLQIGLFFPFAQKEILDFLRSGYSRVLIAEELDPIAEHAVRVLAQKHGIACKIYGKGDFGLLPTGEWTPDIAIRAITGFLNRKTFTKSQQPLNGVSEMIKNPAPRPPVLCAGCPHRATFYLLKLVIPRENSELIMCGDIGCFGLGALPPLAMIDTINHMGMSISMAQGLEAVFKQAQKPRKVVALLGDGTFFHSGLSALVNALYTRANILVVIFDNRTVGMTGHQSNPGAARTEKYHQLDIANVVKGLGVAFVEEFNPFELKPAFGILEKAMQTSGASVVIAKAPCIFLPEFVVNAKGRLRITVNPDQCNTCANHEDPQLNCSRCYAPKNNLSRARSKMFAQVQIPGERQECPANICNHGFFNSILEGDYKSAVEVVRDKMLFARTCGDICHRPCELFSDLENPVPIKALKRFVSASNENYRDFSIPKQRVVKAEKKNHKVAVVGAGPAGLSAAYDLLQVGYSVEIFEKSQVAGGMVAQIIPDFRMDKEGMLYEAAQLKELGAVYHYGRTLGRDLEMNSLSAQYDAVILAIGLWRPKLLDIALRKLPSDKHMDALQFLAKFNQKTPPVVVGDIVVVGGGNSALDAARAAKKAYPAQGVTIVCIETQESMPAFADEIEHALQEGITLCDDAFIVDAEAEQHQVLLKINTFSNKMPLKTLRTGLLISAIGQQGDTDSYAILGKSGCDTNGRVNHREGFSGYANVFVAGDISAGTHMSLIGAIASGKLAANSIRQHLEQHPYAYEGRNALERLNRELPPHRSTFRVDSPEKKVADYSLYQSCEKCNHCIDNFGCPAMVKISGKVVIDEARCTLCGLCIDVCPNDAIHWEEVREPIFEKR